MPTKALCSVSEDSQLLPLHQLTDCGTAPCSANALGF